MWQLLGNHVMKAQVVAGVEMEGDHKASSRRRPVVAVAKIALRHLQ